jgi:hypothetical protein
MNFIDYDFEISGQKLGADRQSDRHDLYMRLTLMSLEQCPVRKSGS